MRESDSDVRSAGVTLLPARPYAVIGTTFSRTLLLHMVPSTGARRSESLHSALLKLIGANFISRSVVGQTERFSFVHSAVQEVSVGFSESACLKRGRGGERWPNATPSKGIDARNPLLGSKTPPPMR